MKKENIDPESILIVYGSLAPGMPNHTIVRNIRGHWRKGFIYGMLENKGWGAEMGFAGLKPVGAASQNVIEVDILFSADLQNYWPMLDDFEGKDYQRIPIRFELENGWKGIGQVYALWE